MAGSRFTTSVSRGDVKYEVKTVQWLRGTEPIARAKWEKEGWEFVGQADAPLLQTKLTFRRPKERVSRRVWAAWGALAAVAVIALVTGSLTEHRSGPSTTPPVVAGATARTTPPVAVLDVVGQKGDEASAALQSAGFETAFDAASQDVVQAADWTVDATQPAAGTRADPGSRITLVVHRTAASPAPSDSASPSPAVLTIANNKDLATLLSSDGDQDATYEFAEKYPGAVIKFDGVIADVIKRHGMRYDLLVYAGDHYRDYADGPNLKFENVSMADLNFVGPNNQAAIREGQKLRLKARVLEYNQMSDLLELEPIATKVRVKKPGRPDPTKFVGASTSTSPSPSAPSTGGSGGPDANWGTCYNAKAHGADTPYVRGQNPEYYYYIDRDSDGVVCE
jgi:hypothetical protein